MKHILRLLAKIVLIPLGVSISSIAYAQTDTMKLDTRKVGGRY